MNVKLDIEKYAFILSRSPNGGQQRWDPNRGMPPFEFQTKAMEKHKNKYTYFTCKHIS